MESYDTLTEGIEALRKQGYTEDFNLKDSFLEAFTRGHEILHDEFKVDKFFRFEANTDPDDQSILYAISSEKYSLKGILVNSYGIYSESFSNEMMDKLKAH
jgi:hypothetical protein